MNETCDDGLNDTMGCNPDCMGSLAEWVCVGNNKKKDICKPVCGDNIILLDIECEDGNIID